MSNKPSAAADGQKSAPLSETAAPLELHCKVLINGMLYAEAHHAKGKEMLIPKEKAEYLAGMSPPQVEIMGVG